MPQLEHFDLREKRAVVVPGTGPVGLAIGSAFREAGAVVESPEASPGSVRDTVTEAIAALNGIDILATVPDVFAAQSFTGTSETDLDLLMAGNFRFQFSAAQVAINEMVSRGKGGNVILLTSVLGERGLPNTAAYSAAQGAVFNLIRALAQEFAPAGISVNGIELGWMEWMSDRLDPTDESAARAIRFTMAKRAGRPEDIGPLAVWLAGSGVGFVTGQIFPLDGGLTQHL